MMKCPRCGKRRLTRFPALSRFDNLSKVCPSCGTDEALIQFSGGKLLGPASWPQPQMFEVDSAHLHDRRSMTGES